MLASTFLVFVQMCDVCPLVRANCFSADAVADCFLLNVDLPESSVQVLLPVDLITVDLIETYRQVHEPFILMMELNRSVHHSYLLLIFASYKQIGKKFHLCYSAVNNR